MRGRHIGNTTARKARHELVAVVRPAHAVAGREGVVSLLVMGRQEPVLSSPGPVLSSPGPVLSSPGPGLSSPASAPA